MSDDKQENRFAISLRIRHPRVDPAEISRELEWQPRLVQKVGEARTTPKGTPLSGNNRESSWIADIQVGPPDTIAAAIRHTNAKLHRNRSYLEKLSDSGGEIEYFIGWFIDSNTGELLDWSLLRQCADLRIQLALDVYPREASVNAESSGPHG